MVLAPSSIPFPLDTLKITSKVTITFKLQIIKVLVCTLTISILPVLEPFKNYFICKNCYLNVCAGQQAKLSH